MSRKNIKPKINTNPKEEPNEFMIQALKEAEADKTSPAFDNAKDFISWLNDKNPKYED